MAYTLTFPRFPASSDCRALLLPEEMDDFVCDGLGERQPILVSLSF